MKLNNAGKMIKSVWTEISEYYPGYTIDEFIIMPNHIHAILVVGANPRACIDGTKLKQSTILHPIPGKGQGQGPVPTISVPDVVGRFKTMTTNKYIYGVRHYDWEPFNGKLWQRNYHEHIIRNNDDLNRIREYIKNNPQNWNADKNNPNK